jgi:hypothetical protein
MKKIKILVTFCIMVAAAFILYIFFAGVNLVLENHSAQEIPNVEIRYGKGTFSTNSIQDKEIRKKSLGKIGEGATFDVHWNENSGVKHHASFNVYFHGFSGYNTIQIRFLPLGQVELYQGKRVYKPTGTTDK